MGLRLHYVRSKAEARKLVGLAARGEIKGRDDRSGASVVAEILMRSPPLSKLPERVHPETSD